MDAYFNLFIIIVVYLLAEITKKLLNKKKNAAKYRDLIPHLCLIIGAAIAILLLYVYPSALSEGIDNPIQAFICGAISGVAATGSNQLFSRTVKFKNALSNSFEYSDYSEEEASDESEEVTSSDISEGEY